MATHDDDEILISLPKAARLLTISPRSLERLIERGEFPPPIWLGGTRRWQIDSVRSYLQSAPRRRRRSRSKPQPPIAEPQPPAP